MINDGNKCAHQACACMKRQDSDYCSDYCENADKSDIAEIVCECGCPDCA